MNIAFFLNSFPILSQTFIINQITGLIDLGHDVDIYAHHIKDVAVLNSDIEKYNLLDRAFQHRNSRTVMPHNKFERVSEAIRILRNVDNDPYPLYKSLNFAKFGREAASLGLFYKISTFLGRRDKYDILHCHFGPNGNLAAKLRSIGAINGKIVTTFHGYDISKYVERHGPKVYDDLFRQGDMFLPISHEMKNRLINLGCPPEKILVHRMGVDLTKFTPPFPKKRDNISILTVGRLVEKKGITYGIQAISQLLKRFPGIKYSIVGDGPMRDDLESSTRELGVEEKVEFLGWRGPEEVRELMRSADIFLAPSVTDSNGDKEGLPVVLMEALACGLPVVSTLHSAIPELVEDGSSGFLVAERNVGALVERLTYMLDHPERLVEMGRAGRCRVEKEFNIHKLNDRLLEIYSNTIKGGSDGFRSCEECFSPIPGEKDGKELAI
jgi:colanic acid/amylovoran biosynthesis glycosyltransferase